MKRVRLGEGFEPRACCWADWSWSRDQLGAGSSCQVVGPSSESSRSVRRGQINRYIPLTPAMRLSTGGPSEAHSVDLPFRSGLTPGLQAPPTPFPLGPIPVPLAKEETQGLRWPRAGSSCWALWLWEWSVVCGGHSAHTCQALAHLPSAPLLLSSMTPELLLQGHPTVFPHYLSRQRRYPWWALN